MILPPNGRPSPDELKAVNTEFEGRSPQDVVAYAIEKFFPRLVLACSFGAEDVVLVDMMVQINPRVPLFYLDTDFLFPETHQVREAIVAKYGLAEDQVIRVKPELTPEEQARQYGEALWERDPDLCCRLRKVEPLGGILKGYAAWMTGIRRDQSPTRAKAALVEWDETFQLIKVNPLAAWSWEQVWAYIHANGVPYNTLHEQNYPSIGCTHCTAPVLPGEDPRSGRWKNLAKTECGLHKG